MYSIKARQTVIKVEIRLLLQIGKILVMMGQLLCMHNVNGCESMDTMTKSYILQVLSSVSGPSVIKGIQTLDAANIIHSFPENKKIGTSEHFPLYPATTVIPGTCKRIFNAMATTFLLQYMTVISLSCENDLLPPVTLPSHPPQKSAIFAPWRLIVFCFPSLQFAGCSVIDIG